MSKECTTLSNQLLDGSLRKYLGEDMQQKLHMDHHPGTNPEPFTTIITGFQEANALLESTYCYPRGGGQPGDTGTMVAGDIETNW